MTTVDTMEEGDTPPPHRARIQWGPGEIIAGLGFLVVLGGVLASFWGRSAQAEMMLRQHEEKLQAIPTLQGDMREMRTDVRWIRERLERSPR